MTDIALENRLTALEAQHAAVVKERDELRSALTTEKIGRQFALSKYVAEKLAVPADILEARFRGSFKLEKDAVVGYDSNGDKIYSRQRPGLVADFDEALEILVGQYPQPEALIKGNRPQNGKTITRTAFESLSPAERMAHIKAGGVLVESGTH